MPVTTEELRQMIREEFPGADVESIQEENHHIFGSIIWEDFRKMENRQRNRLVTEKVRYKLGLRGLNVGILFPRAPGEKL